VAKAMTLVYLAKVFSTMGTNSKLRAVAARRLNS
jgi:hypothetical protein